LATVGVVRFQIGFAARVDLQRALAHGPLLVVLNLRALLSSCPQFCAQLVMFSMAN
jgi:hypothetical protein